MYQKKFTVDKQLENKYKSLFDYLDNDAWATEVEMERAQAINKLMDNVRFLSFIRSRVRGSSDNQSSFSGKRRDPPRSNRPAQQGDIPRPPFRHSR